jgi:DNA-binding NarL/FixJ family response regulator
MPPATRGRRPLVLIADAAVEELDSLRRLLELDGYAVVAFARGDEALAAAERVAPALAILDVNLPGLSGYEVCAALRQRYGRRLPILFVSGDRTEHFDRVAGLLVGADDYLPKPFAADELLTLARALVDRPSADAGGAQRLTRRELQVLELLVDGHTKNGVAQRLGISQKTVNTHVEHIYAKLGVSSRARVVAEAYRHELVRTP